MHTRIDPQRAAHQLRLMLQTILRSIEATPQFTAANLLTLLAVMEEPGATQPEIYALAGKLAAKDPAVLSRQLRYLRGKRQGVVQSPLKPMVVLEPKAEDNRVNQVYLTEEGDALRKELARMLSHAAQ